MIANIVIITVVVALLVGPQILGILLTPPCPKCGKRKWTPMYVGEILAYFVCPACGERRQFTESD